MRSRGDDALCEYARRFDDPDFGLERLRVTLPSLEEARTSCGARSPPAWRSHERVRAFHARQRIAEMEYVEPDGSRYAVLVRPLESIGAYVPGGTASLPSSAIITTVRPSSPESSASSSRHRPLGVRRASIRRFCSRACCAASTNFTQSEVRKQLVRSRTGHPESHPSIKSSDPERLGHRSQAPSLWRRRNRRTCRTLRSARRRR